MNTPVIKMCFWQVACLGLLAAGASAQQSKGAAAPSGETLHYVINWPSGLSLGEAQLTASHKNAAPGAAAWDFQFSLDAAVPGFRVTDRYTSTATDDLCSLDLEKDYTHGQRKAHEKIAFDQQKNSATRETVGGGGKSQISIPACAKDALTFVQYARHELSQGRLPASQTIIFGASYQIRMDYTGTQSIRIGQEDISADRLTVALKGPATDVSFELFCTRDAARTPVLVRVPLALGSFTMELVR